ncbi:3-dehydroquinate dehydratase [Hydrogenivirga caldilitoris]|uniref:3-dehydroquinate dehydratase n=1 Tax=Hydrogenivirga caldilitoris TaxID=246264 RepID=A0A497XWC1_9AQUI|nr:type I 3-dehydroquinate dehydratase [Hydrogenivirga caldilitoris]RLJ71063.1 3-dehydroquinate dehydratase [Hydrogenivirga caldilitoris]
MLIAVPLTDREFSQRIREVAEKGADIVELRVDQFQNTEVGFVEDCVRKAKEEGLKVILTVRSPEEGGREVANRRDIFDKVAPLCDFADIELSSREMIIPVRNAVAKNGGKLIVSFHNFELTPPNWILREVLREGHRYGGIPKLAVKANSYEDVSRLLCVGAQEKYEKILIAMGDIGRVSRIAGYAFGSVITYASLGESLAPGQLPLEDVVKLRELFYK